MSTEEDSSEPSIVVSHSCARRMRGGHPWGFRGEIRKRRGHPRPGDVCAAVDERGRFQCWAFYSPLPLISLRAVSYDREAPPDDALWIQRIHQAAELRRRLVPADTTAMRVVYSEADGLPGLIADRYGEILVVQLLNQGIEQLRPLLTQALVDVWAPAGILARNDQKVRELEGLEQSVEVLHGQVPDEVEVLENGLRFVVEPRVGQKTGAYLDQRETRLAARDYARGRVLDAFTYQGWFAINMAGGAREVIALDGSAPALAVLERNLALNGLTNVTPTQANAFDWLKAAADQEERFDTVLLDPPAFCKNKHSIESGMRGYKEVNLRAMKLLQPGGILITSSCSYHLTEERFLDVLIQAASDSRRTLQILDRRGQGRDHPRLLGHPESYYLKTFILRVL